MVYNDDSLTIVCTGKDGYIHRYGELIDDLKVLGREAFSDGDEFEEFDLKSTLNNIVKSKPSPTIKGWVFLLYM